MTEPTRALSACPFCGGSAEAYDRFNVKCTGCGAEINAQPGQAVEMWNRRSLPCVASESLRQREETIEPTEEQIKEVYMQHAKLHDGLTMVLDRPGFEQAIRALRSPDAAPQGNQATDSPQEVAVKVPAGAAPDSPAGVADMEALYGKHTPTNIFTDSSAAPSERREGDAWMETDGYGSFWTCGKGYERGKCQMQVVRPGKVQCELCDTPSAPPADFVLVPRSFLEATPCPNCSGIGWYPVPNRNTGEAEQQECQWCAEKAEAMLDAGQRGES